VLFYRLYLVSKARCYFAGFIWSVKLDVIFQALLSQFKSEIVGQI
jgi:hypothetical protein